MQGGAKANMTALLGGGGKPPCLFRVYERNSSVAPSDFDRLVSGYHLTQTALLGGKSYCLLYVVLTLTRDWLSRVRPCYGRGAPFFFFSCPGAPFSLEELYKNITDFE